MTLPVLPTAVVGSYAVPEWLERAAQSRARIRSEQPVMLVPAHL